MINFEEINARIQEHPDEFIGKLVSQKGCTVQKVGENYRIQPCPFCGHNDCATFNSDSPTVHCFSCGESMNYWQLAVYALGDIGSAKRFIEEFLGEEIESNSTPEVADKIRGFAADRYHQRLLNDPKYLDYQLNIRKHRIDTLMDYKVGKSGGYKELKEDLLREGYSDKDIDDAKIYIPEGLFVYPYFDRYDRIIRFNCKNPFKVTYPDGKEIPGYCTGEKGGNFYRSKKIKRDSVIIAEGENDLLSLIEAGSESVIATGGSISDEQIQKLRQFKKVYCCFDNDEAGTKYLEKVNSMLPDVSIYQIKFDSSAKDIDDALKRNSNPPAVDDLVKNAVPLENNELYISSNGNNFSFKNRSYEFKISVIGLQKGNYKIDFEYYDGGVLKDIGKDITIDKVFKKDKYIGFYKVVSSYIEDYYNGDSSRKGIRELINIFPFSKEQELLSFIIADKISNAENKPQLLEEVTCGTNSYFSDKILRQINKLENRNLNPDKYYPPYPISQIFALKEKKAYFYFNKKFVIDGEYLSAPCLYTNDKRVIRLDCFKRSDSKALLIVDGCFEMQVEVPVSIIDDVKCSLIQCHVEEFLAGNIDPNELSILHLLDRLEQYYSNFYYTEDKKIYKVLALYSLCTYYYELFQEFPYLYINGPKGEGKSLLCKLLSLVCFNAKNTVGITTAALYRCISQEGGTLILDEMENLTSREQSQDNDLSTILKSGYSKNGGEVYRTNLEKGCNDRFKIYGPKVISCIFGIEDVIEDRSIRISTIKYGPEKLNKIKSIKDYEDFHTDEIKRLTSFCCLSALTNFEQVHEQYMNCKVDALSVRASQILRPLMTIAQLAGDEYIKAVTEYYEKYMKKDKELTEGDSPEGILKEILGKVANEIFTQRYDLLRDENFIKDSYFGKSDKDSFVINTFSLKLLMETYKENKSFSTSEVLKLVKRVFPQVVVLGRTTVSFKDDIELVKRMNNKTSLATYKLQFKFSDFLLGVAKALNEFEISKKLMPKETISNLQFQEEFF